MVHSEVYLSKYVVSVAPLFTSACPHCSQNVENCYCLHVFAFFAFSSVFPGWSADPICPYVRTPMVRLACHSLVSITKYYTSGNGQFHTDISNRGFRLDMETLQHLV